MILDYEKQIIYFCGFYNETHKNCCDVNKKKTWGFTISPFVRITTCDIIFYCVHANTVYDGLLVSFVDRKS